MPADFELDWTPENLKDELGRSLEERFEDAVLFLENKVKKKLTGQRSGRIYTTHFYTDDSGQLRKIGERPPHQASAPDEPPATDTGALRASIAGVTEGKGLGIAGYVGSNLEYALFLEVGTENMEAREFLGPTLFENKDEIMDIIGDRAA